MFKKNKLKVIISSIIILIPILFGIIMWDTLPDSMTTHWGVNGNGNGFHGKFFTIFGLPIILLISHFICLFFSFLDKKQQEQTTKALGIIFWIVPCISLFTSSIVYSTALGKAPSLGLHSPALLGVMFIIIGNYLPKIKQNRTLGIKIPWTLNNEENWNKTHRFGGKLWVLGGLIILFSIFLSPNAMISVLLCVIIAMIIIPIVYSYGIFKKHQKEGIAYIAPPKSKVEKFVVKITAIIVPLIITGIAVVMFTGNIEVHYKDTSFQINADYWSDLQIEYSEIDTISYRKDFDTGIRTSGFGSAKLSMGIFQNDEFGSYTLYAYTGAEEFVVLRSGKKVLVIGMSEPDETQEIYDIIFKKICK